MLLLLLGNVVPQDRSHQEINARLGRIRQLGRHGDVVLAEQELQGDTLSRLARLVVLAPPTGFYGAPGALDGMHVPVMAWAGTEDAITPTDQAKFFRDALGNRVPLDLRVAEGAGHYSFMNVPPPGTTEPLADRDAFLEHLAGEIRRYVACVGTS